jgi:N4-gp56 family major capsid protein
MAVGSIPTTSALKPNVVQPKLFQEYVRLAFYNRFMGQGINKAIQVKMDLTKKAGDTLTFGLRPKLKGTSRTEGDSTLKGREEVLDFYDDEVTVDEVRWAVARQGAMTDQRVLFSYEGEAKDALRILAAEELDADITTALTAAQAGSDRVLYGSATGNTALSDVDNTNDKLTLSMLRMIKRLTKIQCNPLIRPIRMVNGEEFFIVILHPYATRDLKDNVGTNEWGDIQKNAAARGKDNPMFTGALGVWEGLMLYEYEKLPLLTGVGAGGINVCQSFLLGAQALKVAWAKLTTPIRDVDDYGNRQGWGLQEIRGMQKAQFNSKDHGVFTFYTAGVAD